LQVPFEITVVPNPAIDTVFNGSTCLPGEVVLRANSSGDFLRWYDCELCITPIHESVQDWVVPLEESAIFYVEPVSKSGCTGNREIVIATVFQYDPVEITIQDNSLISSYTNGNEWFYKGLLVGATQFINPTESGEYFLQVQIGWARGRMRMAA
jgi:hypothetical protein